MGTETQYQLNPPLLAYTVSPESGQSTIICEWLFKTSTSTPTQVQCFMGLRCSPSGWHIDIEPMASVKVLWTESFPQYLWADTPTPSVIIFGDMGFQDVIRASRMALAIKNLAANYRDIRDTSLIPWSGRSPGRGHDNPLQYSCLENPMDRGAWWATVHRVTKSQTELKWQGQIRSEEYYSNSIVLIAL